jgi:CHASE3 domain sensor protein
MPRHRQLAVGLGLALTLLGVVGWISFASTTELIAATQRVRQTYRVRQRLQTVLNLMRDAETGVRGYLLTGAEETLQPYNGARKGVDRDLKDLRRRTAGNPEQQQWLEQLEPLLARRFQVLDTIIAVRRTEGLAAAAARLRAGLGRELADEIRVRVSQMKHAEAARLLRQERESQQRTRRALAAVGTSAVLGLTILLVVVYLLSREIVERERAEEALRRSETHFRSLTENALDLITVVNADGTTRYVSPSHQRVLGYAPDTLLTGSFISLLHPDDRTPVLESFARVSRTAGAS